MPHTYITLFMVSRIIYPLTSTYFVVEEDNLRGGADTNFIVSWKFKYPISPPNVKAVMKGTSQQQGISFASRGILLENLNLQSNSK